jgi:hypothetical protein
MELRTVAIDNPEELNLVLGQSHFIKTVEDLHEVLAQSSGSLSFGLAFCEASGPRLVRSSGNDDGLVALAERNALAIGVPAATNINANKVPMFVSSTNSLMLATEEQRATTMPVIRVVTCGVRKRGCTFAAQAGNRPSRPIEKKIRGWPAW